MMNLSAVTALSMVVFSATIYDISAFSLSKVVSRNTFVSQSPAVLYATVADDATEAKITTGPDGKAALNYDEDLRLTLQIIMDHQRRSATVTTEQLVQQVTAAAAIVDDEKAVVDISIPYDAAARLAYDKESSSIKASITFENYKIQYEANAVADVIAKKDQSKSAAAPPKAAAAVVTKEEAVVDVSAYDISIPYDAAAKLAYEALSADERSKMEYSTFQQQYSEKAVADVIAKKASKDKATPTPAAAAATSATTTTTTTTTSDADVSIPYDSAAKLAYSKLQSIKHSLTYEQFKQQYEKNAVLNVVAKKLKREQQA
jgi:hypothetical protein